MFRLPPFGDPRIALFGLTMFTQANPGLEKQLEVFANILAATRNSLSAIRSEMHNFEASMLSLATPKTAYTTQPVHETAGPNDAAAGHSSANYSQTNFQQPTVQPEQTYTNMQTMEVNTEQQTRLRETLENMIKQNPDKLTEFLDDLERLIKKYR
ncbi:hypothetical protein [Desulforamulus hydrothermalis]|uniref:Uncharacterized protein n=1 Tax=Desulforamulus hydrothermalis Lam5 = DSM 18033 TaxID=1121428 RepID=K8E0M1_9FIRM|nr:hypothetical protein [Desulforamulus hydrothermalis]CCO09040.1 conserved hypothetical protein [Desulforamulus hydrothermalis Lam5 = DSM 18033]SHG77617.1 hypothetical protein SAMN02745177_00355 [Desulforamulus hydrothermalis Lam5 = DSM 18033]